MDSSKQLLLDVEMSTGIDQFLIQDQLIDAVRLSDAKIYCRTHQLALTHYLVQSKQLNGIQLLQCCLKHFSLPEFSLNLFDAKILETQLLPIEWMRRFRLIPLFFDNETLQLGVTDPTCFSLFSKVRFHTGLHITLSLVNEESLEWLFTTLFSKPSAPSLGLLVNEIIPITSTEIVNKQSTDDNDEPMIQLVNQLLIDAEKCQASDIHCEPYLDQYRVRFRVDGQLKDIITIPNHLALRMLARIKLLANLDVAEKRLPQDGRINAQHAMYPEMRVSTCLTVLGEKMVLRLFRRHHSVLTLKQLGFSHEQLQEVTHAIKKPHGLIIVTGPTGCGKTVTLYAIIHALKEASMNITTIEEPVEMIIPGVNQMNVNTRIGLNFATLLRSILRQDPDIIMIGEIRDSETAAIAMHAASTGHLVLGTLHANHSLAAIHRLTLLGISLQDSLQSMVMIITQRLVRRLCFHCREKANDMSLLTTSSSVNDVIYQAKGCKLCREGYEGRTAIFEVLLFNSTLISMLIQNINLADISKMLTNKGWLSLYLAGIKKVLLGQTTLEEVQRVIGYD